MSFYKKTQVCQGDNLRGLGGHENANKITIVQTVMQGALSKGILTVLLFGVKPQL